MPSTTAGPTAPHVVRELMPDPFTYDKRTGLYNYKRHFLVESAWPERFLSAESAALCMSLGIFGAAPYSLGGFNITDSEMSWLTVAMYPVARTAKQLRHTANFPDDQAELAIEYEGHACMTSNGGPSTTAGPGDFYDGIVASQFEQGTQSAKIVLSYDVDSVTGKRLSIGWPPGTGTNRYIPEVRWVIVQNIAEIDYGAHSLITQDLIGKVNELGWTDPIWGEDHDEGEYLYMGPQTTQNRDGSYTLRHQFHVDTSEPDDMYASSTTAPPYRWHQHLWYFLTSKSEVIPGSTVKYIDKSPTGPQQKSTIYRTAGGPGTTFLFEDLFKPV